MENLPTSSDLKSDFYQSAYNLLQGPKVELGKNVFSPKIDSFAEKLKNLLPVGLSDSEIILYSFSKDAPKKEDDEFTLNPSYISVVGKTTASIDGLTQMLTRWDNEGLILEPTPSNQNETPFLEPIYVPETSDLVFMIENQPDKAYEVKPIKKFSEYYGTGYHTAMLKSELYSIAKFLTPLALKPLALKIKNKLKKYGSVIKSVKNEPYFMIVNTYSSNPVDALKLGN